MVWMSCHGEFDHFYPHNSKLVLFQKDDDPESIISYHEMGSNVNMGNNKSDQMADVARSDPYLLLFAEEFISQMRRRCTGLLAEVSGIVLKEGSNIY